MNDEEELKPGDNGFFAYAMRRVVTAFAGKAFNIKVPAPQDGPGMYRYVERADQIPPIEDYPPAIASILDAAAPAIAKAEGNSAENAEIQGQEHWRGDNPSGAKAEISRWGDGGAAQDTGQGQSQ